MGVFLLFCSYLQPSFSPQFPSIQPAQTAGSFGFNTFSQPQPGELRLLPFFFHLLLCIHVIILTFVGLYYIFASFCSQYDWWRNGHVWEFVSIHYFFFFFNVLLLQLKLHFHWHFEQPSFVSCPWFLKETENLEQSLDMGILRIDYGNSQNSFVSVQKFCWVTPSIITY